MRALLPLGLGLVLLVSGCAGLEMKPGSKPMARRDIAPGPGLLTGSQGEFVIFRVEEDPAASGDAADSAVAPGEGTVAQ